MYCGLLGPFLCIVSFRCCVFCLLVVLAKLSLLAKWLARKTPLKKPNHGKGIVSRKPMPKSAHGFLGLLYCFIVLLCICVISCPYVKYYPTVMARYSLFVLKAPLNPKQTNKHHRHESRNVLAQWQKAGSGSSSNSLSSCADVCTGQHRRALLQWY